VAVLSSWKSTPESMTAPPILIESLRIKGIRSEETDFEGIRQAFELYVHAPGRGVAVNTRSTDVDSTNQGHASV
jgi:hypothetical protein